MRRLFRVTPLLALILACGSPAAPAGPELVSGEIPAAAFTGPVDTAATYEYTFSQVNPDSALRVLLRAGFALREAWYPLDNQCLGPMGPRLTVELEDPNPQMARYHFVPGTGRLVCATRLRRYHVEH